MTMRKLHQLSYVICPLFPVKCSEGKGSTKNILSANRVMYPLIASSLLGQ